MATSAFKSTTNREPVGGGGGTHRRSRSVSRLSRPDEKSAPGGGAASFPEISLDDLALEFFSSSSSWNENGSDGGLSERTEQERKRRGRPISRRGEIGRWASDTASSRRKSRSVSRTRGDASSRPTAAAAVVRERNVGSSGRRRSLSVARHHISSTESEANHFQNSRNHVSTKAPSCGNNQPSSALKATVSSNRKLRTSQSYKDLLMSQDGYSSQSSALTDDELKDAHLGRNGFEKIIRPVYSQKKREPPTEDVRNGGLYEVMRQELRHAVEEICTELNHAMGRNHTALTSDHSLPTDNSQMFQDISSGIRKKYLTKLEQLEKCKQDILNDMLLEEQGGRVNTLSDSRTSSVAETPLHARKRSSDRHRILKRLSEEAEKLLEGFISNLEDTDVSLFDGERSDGSSTIGGRRPKDSAVSVAKTYNSAASNSCPDEMDGVVFPWLQWETSHDGSPSENTKIQNPVTPKALKWDTQTERDLINHSGSSQGSWSPALFNSRGTNEGACQTQQLGHPRTSSHHLEEYVRLKNDEEHLFEMYKERSQINSGRLLLCTSVL